MPPERLTVIGPGQREMVLLRDESGEPVRELLAGRGEDESPRLGFVWVPAERGVS